MLDRSEIFLVVDHEASTRWARPSRALAMEDAQRIIMERWQAGGGVDTFGVPPPDASNLIPWWNRRLLPWLRVEVQAVEFRPEHWKK